MNNKKTAIIVLVAAILVVAVVLFASRQNVSLLPPTPTVTTTTETQDATLSDIQKQGASDDVPSIEKDLEATDFTFIDSDLGSIETELNAALSQ